MHQQSIAINKLIACPDCDILILDQTAQPGINIRCPRCEKILHKHITNSIDKVLAFSLSGLLLYFPAILLPLITMETLGMSESSNVLQTIATFWDSQSYIVAMMMLVSAGVFPLLLLGLAFFIALSLKRETQPAYLAKIIRYYLHFQEWGMVEVYFLGILITIIKMMGSAEIIYNSGIFCFLGLVLTSIGISSIMDKKLFWSMLDPTAEETSSINLKQTNLGVPQTAKNCGLLACHECHKLFPKNSTNICSRCGSKLHQRKPTSVTRTWALVLTSALFFLPANIFPIMQVNFLGVPEKSTILDGIIYFFETGSYGIGIIILTASILVPAYKMVGLIINLVTIHRKSTKYLKQKTKMFRFIEFIGRWSMLDVFVIALLIVLVDFGFFTSIHAAPAASYFCVVVVSTMFAAITFDPRIMWDSVNHSLGEKNDTTT